MTSRNQINITLGTAGHIDHGKTALVKLLTGCDTDRLKAEKERGISIDLGFAPCTLAGREVGIVDVPGHENFIKTMVAGAVGMDAVMLVVAADDGVMPQTREHLEILTLLGVRHGFVALTKIDRVDADYRELVIEQTQGFLRDTFLQDAPICPVSSVTGEGFDAFYATMCQLLDALEPRPLDGVFRLPVDRAFSARGYGTVVAGIPVSGSVRIDDELVLLPEGATSRIRQIEVYGQASEVVKAGQCAAINVRHWDARRIRRGQVVTVPGYFTPQQWFMTRLELLPGERLSLKNGTRLKFHTGTSEVLAQVYLVEGERAEAGQQCWAQFRTQVPVVAGPGDPFIVRGLSPVSTIGGGVILEGLERKQKRQRPGLLDELQARAEALTDPCRFVEQVVRGAESHAVTVAEVVDRTKIHRDQARLTLDMLVQQGRVCAVSSTSFVHRDTKDALSRRVLDTVAAYHRETPASPGMAAEPLGLSLQLERAVLEWLLADMTQAGQLQAQNDRWALPDHQAAFQDEDAKHVEVIDRLFRDRAFQPPTAEEISTQTRIDRRKVDRLLRMLQEQGRLVRVDGGILFHREAVDRARQMLVDYIRQEGRLESVKFKYLLNTSRKFAIPLLDYLDGLGLTRRDGHTRYLKD